MNSFEMPNLGSQEKEKDEKANKEKHAESLLKHTESGLEKAGLLARTLEEFKQDPRNLEGFDKRDGSAAKAVFDRALKTIDTATSAREVNRFVYEAETWLEENGVDTPLGFMKDSIGKSTDKYNVKNKTLNGLNTETWGQKRY